MYLSLPKAAEPATAVCSQIHFKNGGCNGDSGCYKYHPPPNQHISWGQYTAGSFRGLGRALPFFTLRQGHQLCHRSTLVVPGRDAFEVVFTGSFLFMSLGRVCARTCVFRSLCSSMLPIGCKHGSTLRSLSVPKKPHMRAPANFTHESCRNRKIQSCCCLMLPGKRIYTPDENRKQLFNFPHKQAGRRCS